MATNFSWNKTYAYTNLFQLLMHHYEFSKHTPKHIFCPCIFRKSHQNGTQFHIQKFNKKHNATSIICQDLTKSYKEHPWDRYCDGWRALENEIAADKFPAMYFIVMRLQKQNPLICLTRCRCQQTNIIKSTWSIFRRSL